MKKLIYILILISLTLYAQSAKEIMKKVDENSRGESVHMKVTLSITSHSHTRTMKVESFSEGKNRSFVKILYPPKERGITFLSLNNQMWQYIPKIERIIKIPPSMMLQNWMGSDITNDDMVKQSSIIDDYDSKILKRDGDVVTIELTPKEDASVVWGKIISEIDTKTFTSKKDIFYDEDGEIVREFIYEDVKKFGKYYLAKHWKILPKDKKSNFTEIYVDDAVYDKKIPSKYFSKSALKRFSR